ncbi:MAG TPA: UxaA family hydrolase, partial [Ferruginibacter sp.]|nr:UxaA family hydrolase [Ferruginibacter sp.]
MKSKILKIHERDNVIVALQDLEKGSELNINGRSLFLEDKIPAKHKFFTSELQTGDEIIMYGVLVGKAQQHLLPGNRMTTGNVKHAASPYRFRHVEYKWQPPD